MDGRRLDTKEKALAFLAEIEAERAAGVTVEDLQELAEIIASKEWADRPKDHQALPELRRLAEADPVQAPQSRRRDPGPDLGL